ncbi:hypothetical protein LEMLEM_LOCUS20757 [Lemmus lemmus]
MLLPQPPNAGFTASVSDTEPEGAPTPRSSAQPAASHRYCDAQRTHLWASLGRSS